MSLSAKCSKCGIYDFIENEPELLCANCERREHGTTMLLKVDRPGPSHTMVTVFVGVKGQRANCGRLILRTGEVDEVISELLVGDFIEVERAT